MLSQCCGFKETDYSSHKESCDWCSQPISSLYGSWLSPKVIWVGIEEGLLPLCWYQLFHDILALFMLELSETGQFNLLKVFVYFLCCCESCIRSWISHLNLKEQCTWFTHQTSLLLSSHLWQSAVIYKWTACTAESEKRWQWKQLGCLIEREITKIQFRKANLII